jgi:hypothetical protein
MPKVFTAPIAEARHAQEAEATSINDAVPYYEGVLADEPDALVRSFAAGQTVLDDSRVGYVEGVRSARYLRQEHHADPPQCAGFHKVGVAGSNRVTVDALRRNLLSLAALQGLLNINKLGISFGYDGLHQLLKEDTARFRARRCGASLRTRW